MTRTLLLFDIDGTLMLSGGAGMRAMALVAGRRFGEAFRWDGIDPGGHLDPLIFHEAARLNGLSDPHDHHDGFRDEYIAQLRAEMEASRPEVRVMPGIHELLAVLRRREREAGDITLGLLSGNYRLAVPIKLSAIGVDLAWFSVTAFGDEAPTRADLVGLAMQRCAEQTGEPVVPQKVVVIGDTPRDVACARAHGCVAFAVATGGVAYEALEAVSPDVLVRDLSDPAPLLRLLG